MKKLFRILAVGLTAVSCFFAVGCGDTSADVVDGVDTDIVGENEVLISGMNNWHEMTGFSIGRNIDISVNRDQKYVKGGEGSVKIYFEDIVGRVENSYKQVVDVDNLKASQMEEVSVWVYSANDYETDLLWAGYDMADRVIFSQKTVLAPNAWTEVSLTIDRYQMKISNPTFKNLRFVYDTHGEKTATYYFDSLKVKVSEEEPETQTKESFESGEILNFSTLSDLLWATPVRRNTYGEIITIPTYDYSSYAPFSENGGALKLGVNRLSTNRSSTILWNGSMNLTELTGFKVPNILLNEIDFTGTTKISVDVYHDYTKERQMTLIITDEVGTSASVSLWVQPLQWTTLAIEEFGLVDFGKIVAVEFFYTEYMTFEDYTIYVDNLCYVKEA